MGLLWLIYALNTNMRQWFSLIQPSLVEEYHLTPAAMGFYTGLLTMSVGVSGVALSPWLDRGGHGWARKYRHLPIALCYFAFSVLSGINALSASFALLFCFQLAKNLASGIGEASEVTAVAEWWPLERRGFAQGLHHTAFPWGSLLGGLATSAVFAIFGSQNWRYVFLILPWLLLPVLFVFWRFSTAGHYASFTADTRRRGLTPPLLEDVDGHALHAAPGAFRRAIANPNILVSPSPPASVTSACTASASGCRSTSPLWRTIPWPRLRHCRCCSPSPAASARSCGARSRTGWAASTAWC